jgi:hypothetical protein
MHRLFTVALVAVMALKVCASTPASPPLEPVNWEATADSRFEPRVEQVLIALTHYTKPLPAEPWTAWDLAALDRLRTLMDDARWNNFSQTAIRLFYQCPLEGALEIQAAELHQRADAAVQDPKKAFGIFQTHLSYAADRAPALIRPFLEHSNANIRVAVTSRLIRDAQTMPDEVLPVIDGLAISNLPEDRQSAAYLLCLVPSKENSKRALALAATVSDETVKSTEERLKNMRVQEEHRAAVIRAREPMGLILNKEKKQ